MIDDARSYRTLAGPLVHEIPKIKGSRFIASVAPASSADEAREHVRATRALHHAARHVCFAWRLGPTGEETRASDDGEPGGSAGRPILAALTGHDLTFAVVAVTRYFGGTKLGVGGLVRAYNGAADAALALAEVRVVVPTVGVHVEVDYPLLDLVERHAAERGLAAAETAYGARVTLRFEVPVAAAPEFCDALHDRTGGRVRARRD